MRKYWIYIVYYGFYEYILKVKILWHFDFSN